MVGLHTNKITEMKLNQITQITITKIIQAKTAEAPGASPSKHKRITFKIMTKQLGPWTMWRMALVTWPMAYNLMRRLPYLY